MDQNTGDVGPRRSGRAGGRKRDAGLAMPETQLQTAVIQLARLLGWRSAHFRAARTVYGWRTPVQGDGKGFPDTLLLREGRLIVAELKSATGRLTPEQEDWLAAWRAVPGVEVYTWTPDNLEEIAVILR